MSKYRNNLPQLNGHYFLTDGGLETTLVYHLGMNLPHFASFEILNEPHGKEILRDYFTNYLLVAKKHIMGFILESPTWRANEDWGYLMGYSSAALAEINKTSIAHLEEIRNEFESDEFPLVISGCIGPRGDGYRPNRLMNIEEAKKYHEIQVKTFSQTNADLVTAFTLNYTNEALGITQSAQENNIPVVIGFTVETDGRLPSGESLQEAIELIDNETDSYPVYYMINCAHPSHFIEQFWSDNTWKNRIMAIRANASKKSHEELDNSVSLDIGDKCELAFYYRDLKMVLPNLKVVGGCCGTDHTHIEEICRHFL